MKVFKVDVYGDSTGVIEIEDKLEDFYREIKTDVIDIVVRYIDGQEFDIVCDDEGLLKDKPRVSAMDGGFKPMLVGNLLIAHHDDEGNLTGISEEDSSLLMFHTMRVVMKDKSENDVLYGCEYYPEEEDE